MLKEQIEKRIAEYKDLQEQARALAEHYQQRIANARQSGRDTTDDRIEKAKHNARAVSYSRVRADLEDVLLAVEERGIGGWKVIPRRPYDDDYQNGYLESDMDFVLNNLETAVALLESHQA